MVFNSNIFLFVFLPIVFTLFWLAQTKQQRYVLLTVSGFVFYGYWNWHFVFLLLFSSLFSFLVALRIDAAEFSSRRRFWVVLSVSVDLAILGFFKYYNFAVDSIHTVIPSVAMPVLNVILPVGISFYTFHTISYVVDVASGRIRATKNVFEYLTYVSLFSQLVAGPIVRFRQIETDLENIDGPPKVDWMAKGIGFFVVGLIKKVIIADQIAPLIDPMLQHVTQLSTLGCWLAALGYTFQLYFDFSGYSDMAVGLGYMFGLRIPQNFDAPYRASGFRDFWRRWHISLSTWLRDYLYIPLGGSRVSKSRMNSNLFITMVLGGLWHGANWTFVAWGAYHGVLLILEHYLQKPFKALPTLVQRVLTFVLVVIGWVLFRSTNFGMALDWLAGMFGLHAAAEPVSYLLIAWVLVCLTVCNFFPETWDIHFPAGGRRWAVAYGTLFFFAYLFINGNRTVFLYYQF